MGDEDMMSRSAGAKLRRSGLAGPAFATMRLQAGRTKFAFIAAHASVHAIRFMCRVISVTRSCYYAWQRAAPRQAKRTARRESLGTEIEAVFLKSKKR
jgi:hypothetical protein